MAAFSATELVHPAVADRMLAELPGVPRVAGLDAIKRRAIVERWMYALVGGQELGFRETQVTTQFRMTIQARFGVVVSRSTLYGWRRRYEAGGLAALVDGRGGKRSMQQGAI